MTEVTKGGNLIFDSACKVAYIQRHWPFKLDTPSLTGPQKSWSELEPWRFDLGAEASERNLILKLGQNLWCPSRRASRPSFFPASRAALALLSPSVLLLLGHLPSSLPTLGQLKVIFLALLSKESCRLLVTRTTLTTQYLIEGRKVRRHFRRSSEMEV